MRFGRAKLFQRFILIVLTVFILAVFAHSTTARTTTDRLKQPKIIVISIDGAMPSTVDRYLSTGVLKSDRGIGRLKRRGVSAKQNITVTPSLTAPAHIAIGTGSTAVSNNINANNFHLVVSPFAQNISGFAAPIGGYSIGRDGPVNDRAQTAESLWVALRNQGKKVVAATFPGADGIDVTIPGIDNSPILQPARDRTVDYTVPYGTFGGVGARGFSLTAADFSLAPSSTIEQLKAAAKVSYSPILQKTTSLESFTTGGVDYTIQVAALDTTDDKTVNYDTLVFFDQNQGIQPGPFNLPSTGPAYIRASDRTSRRFYLEGNENKAGTSFYVTKLAPDLSQVRFARYSVNYIPRNPAVLADVDDINNNVGFWISEADFRIPQQISPGFTDFPEIEREAIYQDQVRTFVDYQTRIALRAISQNPDADLVLTYIQQPDGAWHQFLLTDPRQPSDISDPNSIGNNQDQEKIKRYQSYLQRAYQAADDAVERIIQAVGTDRFGRPRSNIILLSDHGFETFHTAVSINNFLSSRGFDNTKVRAVSSGPAVNIYINLQGREPDGIVTPQEYVTLQRQIVQALGELVDTNPNYTRGQTQPVFAQIYSRPVPNDPNDPRFGLDTNEFIGQDYGDVFAILSVGYNFDGTQNPVVQRLGDVTTENPVLSVPSFYGAHGYDSTLPSMSAILYAAGPNIGRGTIRQVRNIDIAPTINRLLRVRSAPTVQGKALNLGRLPRYRR
ncbi:phosphodiesterase [Chroococcidiopsis sp. TS-821]|nr:phosphodiesterase [Chroococcidiopsis sp. TS-821]